ncbi:MAG: flagellar biosynthesis anti-sigma factor FlgM [Desulfobia sp.]
MKVTDIISQIINEYKIENKKEIPDRKQEQEVKGLIADRVEISRDVQEMEEMVRSAPEERTELVRSLKQEIESGEYKVDSGELAGDMLIDFLKEQGVFPE